MYYSLALNTRNVETMKNVTSQSLNWGMNLSTAKHEQECSLHTNFHFELYVALKFLCILHFLQWTDISGPQSMLHDLEKEMLVLLSSTRRSTGITSDTTLEQKQHMYSILTFYFQLNFLYGVWDSHNKELCIKVLWNVSPCSLVETCLPHYMVLYPRQLRS